MKVLITGGAGFIGSHLADRLLAQGADVLVVDNFATGRRDNLAPHERLTIVEGTVADSGLVMQTFAEFRPDVAVHAAASYKDPDDWAEDALTNVVGGANVCKGAAAAGCGRVLYFQTALCYGLHPLEQPITLAHPLRPFESSYAISKTAAEEYIALSGLDFVSFRLANAYGPRNLSGPLPTFFQRLTSGKSVFVMDTRRDFIYVRDLVDCVMKAIAGTGHGYYHISSGSDFSIEELFNEAVSALGVHLEKPVEVRPRGVDDAFTILLDPSRTVEDFGWEATTPLRDGVAAAIEYYRDFGLSETYTHLRGTSSADK
jgi:UDP-glucose 4-epimerase